MISMLDEISVAYMGMIASILMAAAMFLNWQVQKQQPGMALWTFAYISGAIGIILIGLRSSLSHVVSIALANIFLVLPGFPWVAPVRNWPGRGPDHHRRSRWLS